MPSMILRLTLPHRNPGCASVRTSPLYHWFHRRAVRSAPVETGQVSAGLSRGQDIISRQGILGVWQAGLADIGALAAFSFPGFVKDGHDPGINPLTNQLPSTIPMRIPERSRSTGSGISAG